MNPLFVGAALGAGIGSGAVLIGRGLTRTHMGLAELIRAVESPPPSRCRERLGTDDRDRRQRSVIRPARWTLILPSSADHASSTRCPDSPSPVSSQHSRLSSRSSLRPRPAAASIRSRSRQDRCCSARSDSCSAGSRWQAKRRNAVKGFVAELAAYLDMVAQLLTGGAGVEDALWRAARNARSPGVMQIRDALQSARTSRRSEWHALGTLATRTRVSELGELVTAVELAGNSGAKVSASLIAKAKSLRDRTAASQLAAAQRASERMGGPLIGMLLAFLVLVIAPALAAVMRI